MPEVQEVFRMSTQKVKPDPGALERQHTRQRRRSAGRKFGAIAVAAAIGLIAVVLILVSRPATDTAPAPAGDPSTPPLDLPSPRVPTEEGAALSVAKEFVQAVGAFDPETAMAYLTDDAELSEGLTPGQLPLLISLYEAQGYRQILDSCRATGVSQGVFDVRCAFDFHTFGSDEIGRGPYHGSYWDITITDGEITHAVQEWEIDRFSSEMWEPFTDWVSATHPEDFGGMYTTSDGTNFRISEESVRLWKKNTARYVEAVLAGEAE